jgi:transposase-like protein
VRHKALVIAYGVHETGRREVIGIDVGEAETQGRSGGRSCVACAPAG